MGVSMPLHLRPCLSMINPDAQNRDRSQTDARDKMRPIWLFDKPNWSPANGNTNGLASRMN